MRSALSTLLILVCSFMYAQDATSEYIGNKKCKMCHNKAENGAQYSVWEGTAHAKAFDVLLTDKAKAIAKKKGLTTTPDQAGECLQCHVTGWGTASGYKLTVDATDAKAVSENEALKGVGCESCHGAGSLYKSKAVMVAVREKKTEGASVGLVTPNEAVCRKCHNEKSPTAKPFVFAESLAKIAHPYPN